MYYDGVHINGYYYVYCGPNTDSHCKIILSKEGNPIRSGDRFYKATYCEALSGTQMLTRATWCQDNCNGDWLIGAYESGFCDEDDLFAYKMRWL